jgi:hypothetical protein
VKQNIEKVSIMGNNMDERLVEMVLKERKYLFKFENLNEFRDFLIYFIFVRKTSNKQQLFEPSENVAASDLVLVSDSPKPKSE